MEKVKLSKEKETLIIPLVAKALESKKDNPIIYDESALKIYKQIEYDFESLNIPTKTNIMMAIRAKIMDDFVENFLGNKNNTLALHLGCGLDSRYNRIKNKYVDWYDLDFKEVIDIRKKFFEETSNYHMIGSSVTKYSWIDKIPKDKDRCIVIAEGLFMYLKYDEIKDLLINLKEKLGSFTLIFDAYSKLTARNANKHPSIKKTKAIINWGINNPKELEEISISFKFIEELFFTDTKLLDKLNFMNRIIFKLANIFKTAKRAHRILVYKIDDED
ncbi:MAG: class I SAM-dependent methyltransferase [Bacillota bacterium]